MKLVGKDHGSLSAEIVARWDALVDGKIISFNSDSPNFMFAALCYFHIAL